MAGNIIVGFAPVAAGAGKLPAGFAPAADGADPLGIFGSLVDMILPAGPVDVEFSQAADATQGTVIAGLAEPPVPAGVEFGLSPLPLLEIDGEELLGNLVAALEKLNEALAGGEPVNPEQTEKLSDAIDALAAMLGIPLPLETAAPAPPPALGESDAIAPADDTAAGAETGASTPLIDEIDALLALAAQAAPRLESESTLAPVPAEGDAAPEVAFTAPAGPAPAAEGETAPPASATPATPAPVADVAPLPESTPPAAEELPATAAPERVEAKPVVDPASSLGQLVQRLTDLARALETRVPELARRLDALVQKLASGDVSASALAELGLEYTAPLDEAGIEQAIARLLSTAPESKGAPVPQTYAPTQLEVPEIIALPPKAAAAPAAEAAPVAPAAAETEASAEAQPRVPFAPAAPEVSDAAEPRPAARSGAADVAVAASRSDAPADLPQGSNAAPQATVATPPVTGTARAVHAAYQAPPHQINMPQVAFEVVRQIQAGNTRFQIRLDPPELGRIDVKLDVDQSGNVSARMTVERAETLDLMQRDQRTLERALAQAGLDGTKTSLEFSLRQNPFGREDGGDGQPKGSPFSGGAGDEAAQVGEDIPDQTQNLYRGSISASGVNLFV